MLNPDLADFGFGGGSVFRSGLRIFAMPNRGANRGLAFMISKF